MRRLKWAAKRAGENKLLEVPELVAPLRNNAQRVLEEGHNDQEATNGRQMGLQGLRVDVDVVLHLAGERTEFLNWVVRVSSPVACRRSRVGETMRVGLVAS